MAARPRRELQPHRRSAPHLGRLPGRARRLPHRAAGDRDSGRRDPENAGWRFDMSLTHNKIGYALWFAGDLEGALAAFEVSLSIDEDLVARYPDNVDYLRHVTINLNWIGDLKRFDGKPAEALDPYKRSRAITERLIAEGPAEHALPPRPVGQSRQDRRRQAGARRPRRGAGGASLGAGDRRISGRARPFQCGMAARPVDRPQPGRRHPARQGRRHRGRRRIPGRVRGGADAARRRPGQRPAHPRRRLQPLQARHGRHRPAGQSDRGARRDGRAQGGRPAAARLRELGRRWWTRR